MKNLFLFLFCFGILNGFAQQTVIYNFAPSQQIELEDGFSKLIIENCNYISDEGMPDLPSFGASILLAPGHEIDYLIVKSIEFYPAIENINIRPASANFPISKGAPAGYKAVPNPDIYNVNQDFPENMIIGENTSFLRGHAMGTFLIFPVIFNPVQKKAVLIKSITIEIYAKATSKASEALRFLRNDNQTTERIKHTTTNIEEYIFNSYKNFNKRNENPNYDILVVTKQAFTSALNNFIIHKNLWGYKVLVKTIEEIITNYTGVDNAEKMRNCVIDVYENEGISYLMLFGDSHPSAGSSHNSIPYRKLHVEAGSEVDELPSDMYFACLDGTWNSGDGTWGKPGSEDLTHEISVGRLCADNTAEIETFVAKLIKYQETPVVADIKKALMVGENLDNVPTWGGDCKDQIATGGTYNGYITAGLPSDYTINKLYDKHGYWNTTQLRNYFNNTGAHIINHLGHSNVNYNMKLNNWEVNNSNFTNTGVQRTLSIVYSQGCLNGAFDNIDDWGWDTGDDCINEKFHKINGGVVANIGNSRYGWYNPGGTNGPSQRFDRYFFDGIFGKNIFSIGDANSYSKDILGYLVKNNSHLRWCCYELNLLGDPSMDIWTDIPTEFDPQYISVVKMSDTEILVSTGVPFARVAILQNNELLSRGLCDEEGNTQLVFETPYDLASALLSISGHNKFRYEHLGIVFIDAPPVRYLTANVDKTVITLDWKEPDFSAGNAPDYYAIYRDGIKIKTLSPDYLTYRDEGELSWNTTYDYCIRAYYSIHVSSPVCLPAKTDPYCDIVGKISSAISGKTVAVQWKKPEPIAPDNYSVFRDGVLLKETTRLYIIDEVPEDDTIYEYCVVAQYDDCEPEPVCLNVVVGSPIGISETKKELFQVYPNPATGELRITNYELRIKDIVIYDVYGKKQNGKWKMENEEWKVNISHLPAGIYFVKINTEQGEEITKKIVKQ